MDREKAQIGLFISLDEATAPMKSEAVSAGFYRSEYMQKDYPRIQLITINELLHGAEPQMPPRHNPYKLAERRSRQTEQKSLFDRKSTGD
jgi:hypothetical protein